MISRLINVEVNKVLKWPTLELSFEICLSNKRYNGLRFEFPAIFLLKIAKTQVLNVISFDWIDIFQYFFTVLRSL